MLTGRNAPPLDASRDRWFAAAVFLLSSAFTVFTALPGPHWFDTPEFTAVGVALSTSHPPSHPLHALFMRACTLLPFGDAGFRGNLQSALAFSAALALFYLLLRACAPRSPRIVAAMVALLPLLLPMMWFQAVRSEVYALQFLCSAIVALMCQRAASGADLRDAPLLVFALGVAGTSHTYIAAMWLPIALAAIASAAVARMRAARANPGTASSFGPVFVRTLAASTLIGGVALLAYAYLPLRALGGRDVGWGTPDSALELWNTITAKQWQHVKAIEREPVDLGQNVRACVAYIIDQVGPAAAALLLVLFMLGVLGLLRARNGRALAALVVALIAFGSRVIYPFDPLNPDMGGYVMHGFAALLLLAFVAADAIADTLPLRYAPWAFAVVLALCAARFQPDAGLNARVPERIGRALLAEVPVGGTLITSEYWSTFMQWYLQAAEGLRPDVARVFRAQLGNGWVERRLASAHPEVAARLRAFPRSFDRADVRIEPGVEIERLGAMAMHLCAVGMTFSPRDASWISPRDLRAIDARILRDQPTAADSRRMLAYFHAQHASWLLTPRTPDPYARLLALSDVRRAEKLTSSDALLRELRRRLAQVGLGIQ